MINFKVIKDNEKITIGYIFKTGVLIDKLKDEMASDRTLDSIAEEMAEDTISQLFFEVNERALDKLFLLKQMANGSGLASPAKIIQSNKLINELIEILSGSKELRKLKLKILDVLKQ